MTDGGAFYQGDRHEIRVPQRPVVHREDAYEEAGFDILLRLQQQHFWYLGRHRFLLWAVRDQVSKMNKMRKVGTAHSEPNGLHAVDIGGGCGGWLQYLHHYAPELFAELALADSSLHALELAQPVIGDFVSRHHVDLLQLDWKERWDVIFLLDVLEHIQDDKAALRQGYDALRPGGLLFLTTPALPCFWSYTDEIGHHQRRYARADFERLAEVTGFELCRARYFMFFLSPLLLVSRIKPPNTTQMIPGDIQSLIARTHRVPFTPINQLLREGKPPCSLVVSSLSALCSRNLGRSSGSPLLVLLLHHAIDHRS